MEESNILATTAMCAIELSSRVKTQERRAKILGYIRVLQDHLLMHACTKDTDNEVSAVYIQAAREFARDEERADFPDLFRDIHLSLHPSAEASGGWLGGILAKIADVPLITMPNFASFERDGITCTPDDYRTAALRYTLYNRSLEQKFAVRPFPECETPGRVRAFLEKYAKLLDSKDEDVDVLGGVFAASSTPVLAYFAALHNKDNLPSAANHLFLEKSKINEHVDSRLVGISDAWTKGGEHACAAAVTIVYSLASFFEEPDPDKHQVCAFHSVLLAAPGDFVVCNTGDGPFFGFVSEETEEDGRVVLYADGPGCEVDLVAAFAHKVKEAKFLWEALFCEDVSPRNKIEG